MPGGRGNVLQIHQAIPFWSPSGHYGELEVDGVNTPVWAVLGPPAQDAEALRRAQFAARAALEMQSAGVGRLVAVDRHGEQVAWCYRPAEGVSLHLALEHSEWAQVGPKAVAELIACIAETLISLGLPGCHHPGPAPTDVMVDKGGQVCLFGFVGPFPSDPGYQAPVGNAPSTAAVYRLGALLFHLLTGQPPSPATTEDAHSALIRRSLIQAMAAHGPALTHRYGQWCRQLLAFSEDARPALSVVAEGLRSLAGELPGPTLGEWAEMTVPALINDAKRRASMPMFEHLVEGSTPVFDDPATLTPRAAVSSQGIPVDVGPPAASVGGPTPKIPVPIQVVPPDEGRPVGLSGAALVAFYVACVLLGGGMILIIAFLTYYLVTSGV